jgi:hypothetical protein
MKGSDIIQNLGVEQAHCVVGKEMVDIQPDYDYVILYRTADHPRLVCPHHEEMIKLGKYPRLKIEDRELHTDVDWTTGHNAFEGEVEPKHSPERPKIYMVE